jgi:hypothetical protein
MLTLSNYSMGIGDRFARQGKAQLAAFIEAKKRGALVTPVWNKSNREHQIIGTRPGDVRQEADAAVKACGWSEAYHVDADHISLKTVDGFVDASDFFTLDVADFTGKPAADGDIAAFVQRRKDLVGRLAIPGVSEPFEITPAAVEGAARKYLLAVQEAGKLYRHIASRRGERDMIVEVSMDETDLPQSPLEMLLILAAIADEKIPAQTIAPKFTGRFNKGVDYVGKVETFEREFCDDLAVIAFAVKQFGLPGSLKLSVHSGSDKFSLYPLIAKALRKQKAGLHLKTAGTTWLEELIGLAESEGEGLAIAKTVYERALGRFNELCAPYATVVDIDRSKLPTADEVKGWSGEQFARALRHEQSCPQYNPHLRQLLHVGYKVAAELGERYLSALVTNEATVARNVTTNLLERHLKPLFLD